MAIKNHPDKNCGGTEEEKRQAEKRFKDINDAKSILTDPKKKQIFDNGGNPEDPNEGGFGGFGGGGGGFDFGGGGGMDASDIFKIFFSQGQGGGGSSFSSGGGGSSGGSRRGRASGGASGGDNPFNVFFQR